MASAALGFAIMIPLLLRFPPATALIGLLASELATLAWSLGALRAWMRAPGAGEASS